MIDLADSGYALGWALARRVPERTAQAVFAQLADQSWRRGGPGVRMLERNLRRVVGDGPDDDELHRLSRAAMRSYLRYWCETFRLPTYSPDQIRDKVVMHDRHLLDAAIEAEQGLVIALPHAGNWDLIGAWLAVEHGRFTTVAERLKPEKLFDRFLRYRESLGMEVLPLSGEASVYATMLTRLKAGGVVCLMADRDLTGNGVPTTFFGEQAHLPAGPATLAIATGSALMPIDLWYQPDALHVWIRPTVEIEPAGDRRSRVAAATQQLADSFERGIREHPQDWHMLQPMWDVDRSESTQRVDAP